VRDAFLLVRERLWCVILAWAVAAATACGEEPRPAASATMPDRPAPARVSPDAATARPRIVVLGDSLTAGLGLAPEAAYPALLQEKVEREGLPYEVVNAGVSGDTTAGGLRRVDWALDGDVRVLIVALGGNDGLRGLPVSPMRENLTAIVERAQARGVEVVLAGMEAPPNYGDAYTREFREVFREVAEKTGVVFVPFLLDGVAGEVDLNQSDGIHPNVAGARKVAELLWPALRPMLDEAAGS
jgi:acyl-CoA thioesterase-1